ncbi:MAG: hypothetical protein IT480_01155 [Gammaproteobacteria bacterium]|nr:hypothetical protein [Gammaproteobacteria bacterium]
MRPLLSVALMALLAGSVSAGDIYCLKQGKDCSDRPSPGAQVIRTQVRRPDAQPETPAPARPAIVASAAPSPAAVAATRQVVQQDMDEARAEACKKARERYQQSLTVRRIYRTNKDGEREYLSDAEADQLRMNSKLGMDEACGSSGSASP